MLILRYRPENSERILARFFSNFKIQLLNLLFPIQSIVYGFFHIESCRLSTWFFILRQHLLYGVDDLLLQTFRLQHADFCAMLEYPVSHGLFIDMEKGEDMAVLFFTHRKIVTKGIHQLIHHIRRGFQGYIHGGS